MAAPIKERGLFTRGGRYYLRYAVNGRLVREAAGTNKKLALDLLAKRRLESAEGRYFPERTNRRRKTVEEAIDECLERASSLRDQSNRQTHAAWWKAELGARGLSQVTPAHIDKALAKLTKAGRSPATANRYLSFLKRVFSLVTADGEIHRDPIRRVKLARESPGRVRYLEPHEEAALEAAVRALSNGGAIHREIAWAYVQLAIYTGMRRGEQWRARWSDLALDGKQLHLPITKSGRPRWVPLNTTARAALERLRGLDWDGDPQSRICRAASANYFVSDTFRPALDAAGIDDFRWHDLRHTFASRLAMAGANLHDIRALLGHETITMTLRYAHLSPEHLRDAVAMIESVPKTDTGRSDGRKTQ